MKHSPLVTELIAALKQLPGVGPKSAQRMSFQLLQHDRIAGNRIASALQAAMDKVGHCQQCRIFTEQKLCEICANEHRQAQQQLCIVESPANVLAIEKSGQHQGCYFVLMGHLSPIDGIGPEEIGLLELEERLQQKIVQEVILAINPTIEGEITIQYLVELCNRYHIKVTQLAQGVPIGGELEYIDGQTLAYAFSDRKPINR